MMITEPSTNIEQLRKYYLNIGEYPLDNEVAKYFNSEDLLKIKQYGHWFDAIWNDQVPLSTDKLKHFYLAKNELFDDRNPVEDLWFRYKKVALPF